MKKPESTNSTNSIPGSPLDDAADEVPDAAESDRQHRLFIMDTQASDGDLAGLLDVLIKQPRGLPRLRDLRPLLRRSVSVASQKSSRQFAREVYRESMAFLQYLQMRLHAYAVDRMTATDRRSQGELQAPPEDVVDVMPQIEHLMRLTADLSASWAQSMRLWKLAARTRKIRRQRGNGWDDLDQQLFDDNDLPDDRDTDD